MKILSFLVNQFGLKGTIVNRGMEDHLMVSLQSLHV